MWSVSQNFYWVVCARSSLQDHRKVHDHATAIVVNVHTGGAALTSVDKVNHRKSSAP